MKRILISCESLVLHQGYEVTGCVTEKLRIPREYCKLLAGPVPHHIPTPIQRRFPLFNSNGLLDSTLDGVNTYFYIVWVDIVTSSLVFRKQFVISIVAWLPRLNLYSKNKFGAAFEADDIVSYYILTQNIVLNY